MNYSAITEEQVIALRSEAVAARAGKQQLVPEQDQDPRAAPLLADLSGLPPAYVMCGSLGPLLDDSRALHDKLRAARVDATLRIYPGVPHSFLSYLDQVDTAQKAWLDAATHLRKAMHSHPERG